jgi:CheY-like chemotaxis protein
MRSGTHVLVVDDEQSLRRLLRLYLEKEGYTVLEADDGLDALSLLRRGGIDLALVDVMLPELDGFELLRRIRSESGVPIALITARRGGTPGCGVRARRRRLRGQAVLGARGGGSGACSVAAGERSRA